MDQARIDISGVTSERSLTSIAAALSEIDSDLSRATVEEVLRSATERQTPARFMMTLQGGQDSRDRLQQVLRQAKLTYRLREGLRDRQTVTCWSMPMGEPITLHVWGEALSVPIPQAKRLDSSQAQKDLLSAIQLLNRGVSDPLVMAPREAWYVKLAGRVFDGIETDYDKFEIWMSLPADTDQAVSAGILEPLVRAAEAASEHLLPLHRPNSVGGGWSWEVERGSARKGEIPAHQLWRLVAVQPASLPEAA